MKLITTCLTAGMIALSGCAGVVTSYDDLEGAPATLMPRTSTYNDLVSLPKPSAPIYTAVYNFRDQTGQYKPQPASTFSTAVTQGGAAMLSSALAESGWFVPLERVGLQNLLTERRIIRANLERFGREDELDSLSAARILMEGGIVAYDSNMKTGGLGAEYFGIGASTEYQVDQVTVNLRAVDISTGEVLGNVTTSKTIYSHEVKAGVYRFISFKRLLEAEGGFTQNEPVQMAVMSAIESAVVHLVSQGIERNLWSLKNPDDRDNAILQEYANATTPML